MILLSLGVFKALLAVVLTSNVVLFSGAMDEDISVIEQSSQEVPEIFGHEANPFTDESTSFELLTF